MTTRRIDDFASPAPREPRAPREKSTAKGPDAKAARATAAEPRPLKKPERATTPTAAAPVVEQRVAAGSNTAARRQPSHDEIAVRAREIWRAQGGSALENWLRAERELADESE